MKLYVIRHAEAAANGGSELVLTERGTLQALALGGYFLERALRPDVVLTSPVLRAQQTAQSLCEVAQLDAPCVEPWLACGMSPELARAEIKAYAELDTVVIVGHQPDLSYFLADALGAWSHSVKKASLTLLDYQQGSSKLLERFQG